MKIWNKRDYDVTSTNQLIVALLVRIPDAQQ